MKKILKQITAGFLVFLFILTGIGLGSNNVYAESDLSLRDQMIYTKLYQGKSRKAKRDYPTRVTLSVAGMGSVSFTGHAGIDIELSKQEIVDCLKKAANVGKYSDIEQVLDDYDRVKNLKYDLDFTKEDMEEFKKDMKALFGVKSVDEILQDCLTISPNLFNDFRTDNPVQAAQAGMNVIVTGVGIYEAAQSGSASLFKKPSLIPSLGDIVVNGLKLTAEQYKRDLKKWEKRVEYYNKRRDLEAYYSNAQSVIKSRMGEKGEWTISVNDYAKQDVRYHTYLNAPTTYILQLNLSKKNGNISFEGPYTGDVRLQMIADTKAADADFGKHVLDVLNGDEWVGTDNHPSLPGNRPKYSLVSDKFSPSVFETDIGGEYELRVAGGANGIFTAPIDVTSLGLNKFQNELDHYVFCLAKPEPDSRVEYYVTALQTTGLQTDNFDWYVYTPVAFKDGHGADTHDSLTDPRPYMTMEIEVFTGGDGK